MGRAPCCEKETVKRGPWTPEEDAKLLACVSQFGTGSWRTLPKKAGLQRCGKSCRLRWTNYLRPDLKHGRFSEHEEQLIVKFHAALGSRWSLIAAQLPGRTDNDVKNYWNTRLKKKLCEMGIDPITHKPMSQLLADLAGSCAIALPCSKLAGDDGDFGIGSTTAPTAAIDIAEATLGCFKDDMLNALMSRKRLGPDPVPSNLAIGADDDHADHRLPNAAIRNIDKQSSCRCADRPSCMIDARPPDPVPRHESQRQHVRTHIDRGAADDSVVGRYNNAADRAHAQGSMDTIYNHKSDAYKSTWIMSNGNATTVSPARATTYCNHTTSSGGVGGDHYHHQRHPAQLITHHDDRQYAAGEDIKSNDIAAAGSTIASPDLNPQSIDHAGSTDDRDPMLSIKPDRLSSGSPAPTTTTPRLMTDRRRLMIGCCSGNIIANVPRGPVSGIRSAQAAERLSHATNGHGATAAITDHANDHGANCSWSERKFNNNITNDLGSSCSASCRASGHAMISSNIKIKQAPAANYDVQPADYGANNQSTLGGELGFNTSRPGSSNMMIDNDISADRADFHDDDRAADLYNHGMISSSSISSYNLLNSTASNEMMMKQSMFARGSSGHYITATTSPAASSHEYNYNTIINGRSCSSAAIGISGSMYSASEVDDLNNMIRSMNGRSSSVLQPAAGHVVDANMASIRDGSSSPGFDANDINADRDVDAQLVEDRCTNHTAAEYNSNADHTIQYNGSMYNNSSSSTPADYVITAAAATTSHGINDQITDASCILRINSAGADKIDAMQMKEVPDLNRIINSINGGNYYVDPEWAPNLYELLMKQQQQNNIMDSSNSINSLQQDDDRPRLALGNIIVQQQQQQQQKELINIQHNFDAITSNACNNNNNNNISTEYTLSNYSRINYTNPELQLAANLTHSTANYSAATPSTATAADSLINDGADHQDVDMIIMQDTQNNPPVNVNASIGGEIVNDSDYNYTTAAADDRNIITTTTNNYAMISTTSCEWSPSSYGSSSSNLSLTDNNIINNNLHNNMKNNSSNNNNNNNNYYYYNDNHIVDNLMNGDQYDNVINNFNCNVTDGIISNINNGSLASKLPSAIIPAAMRSRGAAATDLQQQQNAGITAANTVSPTLDGLLLWDLCELGSIVSS